MKYGLILFKLEKKYIIFTFVPLVLTSGIKTFPVATRVFVYTLQFHSLKMPKSRRDKKSTFSAYVDLKVTKHSN